MPEMTGGSADRDAAAPTETTATEATATEDSTAADSTTEAPADAEGTPSG